MDEKELLDLIEKSKLFEPEPKVKNIFTLRTAVETVQLMAAEFSAMHERLHNKKIEIKSLEQCAAFWDFVSGFLLQGLLSKRDFEMFCKIIFPFVEQILPEDIVVKKVKDELEKRGLDKLGGEEKKYWEKIYAKARIVNSKLKRPNRAGRLYEYWSEPKKMGILIARHEAFLIIHPLMHHKEFILEDIGMHKISFSLFSVVFKMLRLQKSGNDANKRRENWKSKISRLKNAFKKLKFKFFKKAEIQDLLDGINKNRGKILADKSFQGLPFSVRELFD